MRQLPHTEYKDYRGVGVRLMEPMLDDLTADAAVGRDAPMIAGYHAFDKAHVLMLGEEGLIPNKDAVILLKTLREMESSGVDEQRSKQSWGLHAGESYLINKLGYEIGGRIHLARSSGDLMAVSYRIAARTKTLNILKGINNLRLALLPFAISTADAVMAGQTHGVHAQPTTLGAQVIAWDALLERDHSRFYHSYKQTNCSPAGAAIMTGSPFAVNRHSTADRLGFDSVIPSTFDAIIGAFDYELEAFSAVAILSENLGTFARDIAFWYSDEAELIDIPDRFCHTSSIMMHKKNPVALEQISGSGSDAIGGLMASFVDKKKRSGGAEGAGHSFFTLLECFDTAIRDMHWLELMVPEIEIRRERMYELASEHWAVGPDVASAIVKEKGLSWRIAHQIVGTAVRFAKERNMNPMDATSDFFDEAAIEYMGRPLGLNEKSLKEALDPRVAVSRRKLFGGPAPVQTKQLASDAGTRLKSDRKNVERMEKAIKTAAAKLETDIDTFINK